jgi:hypothetical protein
MSWIEQKYINAVSPRLQFFTKKSDGIWNLRCPICGDSRKSKTKARGFILERGGKYTYVCHNCNVSMSFGRFLETVDPQLYHEYRRETFLETKGQNGRYDRVPQPAPDISKFVQPKFVKYTVLNDLQKVSQLRPDHPVKRYILSRQIPSKYHFKLFLTLKFKEWTNKLVPNKFDLTKGDEPRLIIPLVDSNGNLFGYQGRSFGSVEPRYITIILDSTKPKVYGAESLDPNRTVYVVEGPIDSMFLDNSIAMVGSHLDTSVVDLGLKRDNVVVVYDNEPRNVQIMKQVERAIDNGFRVCIWPSDVQEKDINEMVKAGRSPREVERIIDTHTYKDLMAKAMLIKWKKV